MTGTMWAWLAICLAAAATPAHGQQIEQQKAAVVKITAEVDGARKTGTGFVIKQDRDIVYIVTASHVVEGDSAPKVEFFTARNRRVAAEVIKLEGGNPKGLALIAVHGEDRIPRGVERLVIDRQAEVSDADEVMTIGFGQGQGDWAVLKANIVSHDGRDLKLDGRIEEGNSGGPVLKNGRVVALITSSGQGLGLATPALFVDFVLTNWGIKLVDAAAQPGEPVESPTGAEPASLEPRPLREAQAVRSERNQLAESAADAELQREAQTRPSPPKAPAQSSADAELARLEAELERGAQAQSAGAGAANQLTWQDETLRYVGALVLDVASGIAVLRAEISDLHSGRKIGTYEVPAIAGLGLSPAEGVVSAIFNVPGDSTTPVPHTHTSNLFFREQSDGSAVLLRNCVTLIQCYPASGKISAQ